jgi:hypothetical protein
MKKNLLAAGLFALSFSAAQAATVCTDGTLASLPGLGATPCTITNGGSTWRLGSFHQSAPSTGLGSIGASDIFVSFNLIGNGFAVTFSPVGGGEWAVTTGQTGFLETNFRILDSTGSARITNYSSIVSLGNSYNEDTNAVAGSGSGPVVTLRKYVQDWNATPDGLGGTLTGLETLLTSNNVSLPGSLTASAPPQTVSGGLANAYVIVDKLDLVAGSRPNAVAAVSSYSNVFGTDIPEPMTFALMGAGLVGIAVLRRRRA